jgi:hypothetical protein
MTRRGGDPVTLGNHDFDRRPDGLTKTTGVAAKAAWIPAVIASNINGDGTDPTLTYVKSGCN